jgi:3-oxoacyl-[acyl-carrier protein] reductase
MALDLAKEGIRVVDVAPGAIDTAMLQQHSDRVGVSIEKLGFPQGTRAIGRVGAPEEVADAVLFALSRSASLITGSTLLADGGLLSKF